MSGQTSYSQVQAVALAGQAQQTLNPQRIESKFVAAGSVGFPAGVFVCRSGADDTCDVPAAAGSVTTTGFGIALLNVAQEPHDGSGTVDGGVKQYNPKQGVPVLEAGVVTVVAEATATTYGGAVYARITANGAGKLQLGALRSDTDSGNATLIPGARFLDTTSAGGLCQVLLTGNPAGATGATGATGPTGPTGP